jgi:hypothetical protein
VEYTAAIPDERQNQLQHLHSAYFANKFVVIWVAVSAVNIPVFSSANEARIFGIFKYKTRRETTAQNALNIVFFLTDCVWLGFRNKFLFVHFNRLLADSF